uniref:DNA pilot protein n=1 Tax=Dulem virus 177 TaxID=3145654 RepID=A0AAU8B8B6_9VIRU
MSVMPGDTDWPIFWPKGVEFFMDPFVLSSIIGTAGSLIGGLTNTAASGVQADKNLELQKEMFEYQKGLQKDIFEREDNAVQRRVKDLVAAGLSPVLAAGSASNAGSIVPTTTPQRNQDFSGIERALGAFREIAQLRLLESQADKNVAEADLTRSKDDLAKMDYTLRSWQTMTESAKFDLVQSQINQLNAQTQKILYESQSLELTNHQKRLINAISDKLGVAVDAPQDIRVAAIVGEVISRLAEGEDLTPEQKAFAIDYGTDKLLHLFDTALGSFGKLLTAVRSTKGKGPDYTNTQVQDRTETVVEQVFNSKGKLTGTKRRSRTLSGGGSSTERIYNAGGN